MLTSAHRCLVPLVRGSALHGKPSGTDQTWFLGTTSMYAYVMEGSGAREREGASSPMNTDVCAAAAARRATLPFLPCPSCRPNRGDTLVRKRLLLKHLMELQHGVVFPTPLLKSFFCFVVQRFVRPSWRYLITASLPAVKPSEKSPQVFPVCT